MSDTKGMKKCFREKKKLSERYLLRERIINPENTKLNTSNEDCALRIQQHQEIYDRDRLHKNMFNVQIQVVYYFYEYYSHRVDL